MSTLLLGAASLVVAPVPDPGHFGDWIVACDNGRHCEALGLPPEDGDETDWTLYISRDAKPDSRPAIELNPAFGWEGDIRPVGLNIDGRRGEFGFDRAGRPVGEPMALLAAIAKAREVTVTDEQGRALGTLPVNGSSAALRFMDDRQSRSGTVTAIVARGPLPARAVPPPPKLPAIAQPPVSSKPPKRLGQADIAKIQSLADDFCDPERAQASTYRLDANHTVGIVGCLMGAYQGASLVVVIDEKGHWTPAPIEQPRKPDENFEPYDAYFLTEGDFVESERLLWMSAKGRGLADCGSHATWAWDGKMFRLAAYQALDLCRGAPPGTWLSRWQTANDPLRK